MKTIDLKKIEREAAIDELTSGLETRQPASVAPSMKPGKKEGIKPTLWLDSFAAGKKDGKPNPKIVSF